MELGWDTKDGSGELGHRFDHGIADSMSRESSIPLLLCTLHCGPLYSLFEDYAGMSSYWITPAT